MNKCDVKKYKGNLGASSPGAQVQEEEASCEAPLTDLNVPVESFHTRGAKH